MASVWARISCLMLIYGISCASAAGWTTVASDCSDARPPAEYGNATADYPQTVVSLSTPMTGVPDNALCPGVLYNIKVQFANSTGQPVKRKYIVAATQGQLVGADSTCPNRVSNAAGAYSFSLPMNLSCTATGNTQVVISSIAFDRTESSTYRRIALALPIASDKSLCKPSPCYVAPSTNSATTTASTTTPTNAFAGIDLSALFGGVASTNSNPLVALTSVLQALRPQNASSPSGALDFTKLAGALQAISAVVNPSSTSTTTGSTTDITKFLSAVQTIGQLVSPTTNSTGIVGLLTAVGTLNNILQSSTGSTAPNQLNPVLSALGNIGNLFNPTASTTATSTKSPLQNVIAAGQDVIEALQQLVPATGSTGAQLNLLGLLTLVQRIGAFFTAVSVMTHA